MFKLDKRSSKFDIYTHIQVLPQTKQEDKFCLQTDRVKVVNNG